MIARFYTPKLLTVLREGYGLGSLRRDTIAGLTVAVVALPLSMALAIASGASPDKGLVTAIIAGFMISALGGSRVQIGGPTAAFVVVVFNVIATHGYDGLLIATILAGIILVVAGAFGLGQMIRYIPQPVITGFTAGIAVVIATSQVKDFLGLSMVDVPADFVPRWLAYIDDLSTTNMVALAIGAASLAIIIGLRYFAPRWPGFLIAILASSIVVALLGLPVDTIGTHYPDIPAGLPMPAWPEISYAKVSAVMPSAFIIAFLAGVEALLSAVVADGMAGTRHRPNDELIGEGLANIGSALFAGLPATGAIARTAINIRAGGITPVAGMVHAVFLLLFILFASQLMAHVPMAALAAILFVVAWGMSEYHRFFATLRMSNDDRAVLLLTFGLTVMFDLTVGIGVGVTLASLLFMARMSAAVDIEANPEADDDMNTEDLQQRQVLPSGVEVFRITGPVFFGVAGDLLTTLQRLGQSPRVVILRMRLVPFLDASGAQALLDFSQQARSCSTQVILSGLQRQPGEMLMRAGVTQDTHVHRAADFADAQTLAIRLLGTEKSGK